VLGVMAPYVGAQYSAEEIWGYYRNHADVHQAEEAVLRPLAARIRAFDVPALAGVTFTVNRLCDAAPALEAVLAERLPVVAWAAFDALHLALQLVRIKKYGLIHEVVEAPVDEATGDPMVVELYGRLAQFNGQPADRGWLREVHLQDSPGADDAAIGAMTFRLERATYANTRTPGIGVPFYM
jgi:hypothetical protein